MKMAVDVQFSILSKIKISRDIHGPQFFILVYFSLWDMLIRLHF